MGIEDLQASEMMRHLLEALDHKKGIGERGRLVFVMVARHFLPEEELVSYLSKDPSIDAVQAKALVQQVRERGYSPPKRERILEWQEEQEFAICPNPEDPDACNVYRDLQFPDEVYQSIAEYREQKAESSETRD